MILPYRSHPKELYKGQVSDHKDTHCPKSKKNFTQFPPYKWCAGNAQFKNH